MKKKLNIFFSNSISAHKWGGGEKWMVTAGKGLNERGHNVILSGKSNSVFLTKAEEAGLDIIPLNIYADYNPFKIIHTKWILKREKIDIIVLNLNKDIRVAGIAARWAKIPVIIARNGIQLFSDKWKHKMTMKLVDGIITNSKSIKEAYNRFSWMNENKTTVIYNGLNLNNEVDSIELKAIWNIPKDHLVFVAAGRLTTQKGFDLLIEAVSSISSSKQPFSILIAGMGKERKSLQDQIDSYNLQNIKLIGFQNNLASIIKAADYVIMPSRKEGMPNVIMESMALGKPVLAANVNGVPELLDHNKTGYIFDPMRSESIEEAIKFVLKNHGSKQITNWGSLAKEHVNNNFSLEKMLNELESYFYSQYAEAHR